MMIKDASQDFFAAPAITMIFDADGRVRSSSDDAAAFFGFDASQDLTGMRLTQLLEKIESRMSRSTVREFSRGAGTVSWTDPEWRPPIRIRLPSLRPRTEGTIRRSFF